MGWLVYRIRIEARLLRCVIQLSGQHFSKAAPNKNEENQTSHH